MSIYSKVNFKDDMDSNKTDQYYVVRQYNQLNQGNEIDIWVHTLESTVKPVCNDHLYNKIYYLWFIQ